MSGWYEDLPSIRQIRDGSRRIVAACYAMAGFCALACPALAWCARRLLASPELGPAARGAVGAWCLLPLGGVAVFLLIARHERWEAARSRARTSRA